MRWRDVYKRQMLGFLREANTSKSVIDIYDELDHRLGGQDFRKLFPVILTDNGSEFSNPKCKMCIRDSFVTDSRPL